MIPLKKLQCNSTVFNLICAALITAMNAGFIYKSYSIIAPQNFHQYLFAFTIPLVLFCGWLAIFSVLNLPGIARPLMVILLVGCGVDNYFTHSFGVVIDANMITNVFETRASEASALITPRCIIATFLLGIVPAIFVARISIDRRPWWQALLLRAVACLASLTIIILVAALFYKDYASLLRNNKVLTKMVTPPDYISALGHYARDHWFEHNTQLIALGQDAKPGPVIGAASKKTVLILAVGEASRAENYRLAGYERDTNPELARQDIIWFNNASSCGTETAVSVPCMFSGLTRRYYDSALVRHREGLMDVLGHADINLLWRENDNGCKGVCNRIPHTEMIQWKINSLCQHGTCLDIALLHNLDNVLDGVKRDTVIVLHLIGSHGPDYYRRYPETFRRFPPTCDTNQIQDCSRQQVRNSYDNTILYTDSVLSSAIEMLKKREDQFNTALVYLSDHGESLGERGLWLHGAPRMLAPSQQTHIPFLFWLSPDYRRQFGVDSRCLRDKSQQPVSQDNLFDTVLGMMNIQTAIYRPSLDILATCRRASS